MVRSMYSGVAGMKSNQTRMDVIGNNIANSNTYGFKSSRATFRDMYYQQLRGASAGTATRGGINPSMVGYGSQVSSVDLLMTQSAMTSTGNPLDVCITGEGFLQVMDPDGNIYYTKAGMLDIDSNGYVIDSSGNFVLGTSATEGRLDSTEPGKSKIKIDVAPIQASEAKVSSEVGGKTITITSTNQNKAANVGFTFTKSTELPVGQNVKAIMDGGSSMINIQINATAEYTDMAQLQKDINDAITEAYGGTHPGGEFKFTIEPDPFTGVDDQGNPTKITLTGAEIVTTAEAEFTGGKLDTTGAAAQLPAGFTFKETGIKFSGSGAANFSLTKTADTPPKYEVSVDVNGTTYKKALSENEAKAGGSVRLELDPPVNGDTITIGFPSASAMDKLIDDNAATATNFGTFSPSQPTKNLGLGKGTFSLTGGTEFTEQNIGNLTGISIGADGTIVGTSAAGLQVLGRIDLATFANPKGLMQSGSTYFTETSNSGSPKLAIPGEEGTGALKNSALEMSNVDLAQEARVNGLLSLEGKLEETKDPFLKSSMMLVVDAVEPEKVKRLLETELEYLDERHAQDRAFYDKAAAYAPAFGMIGTLMGLVNLLKSLDDPNAIAPAMALALVTTFYGTIFANLIFSPISNKLKVRHDEEYLCKLIIVEGVESIQAGDNPRFVEEKLTQLVPGFLLKKGLPGGGAGADDGGKK